MSKKYMLAMAGALVATIFFGGLTGAALAQNNTTNVVADYTGLFQAVGGLVAAIAVLAGLAVNQFAKLNDKLHLVDKATIDKVVTAINNAKDSDLWNLENEQRINAVLTFMYNTSPDAKKFMDDHGIDVKNLNAQAEATKKQLEELYANLNQVAAKSALQK